MPNERDHQPHLRPRRARLHREQIDPPRVCRNSILPVGIGELLWETVSAGHLGGAMFDLLGMICFR